MSPTLKPFDILGVMPYNNRKTQCGDLIVFSHPETGCNVVHRAASINSRGISTKADNSKDVDPWILNPDNIHGFVGYVQRRNHQIRILGSTIGRLLAKAGRITHLIYYSVSNILGPIYHWLAKEDILGQWFPSFFKLWVISFNRHGGKEFHLLTGRHIIGRYFPWKDQWQIKFPFRLFIDKKFLAGFRNSHTCS